MLWKFQMPILMKEFKRIRDVQLWFVCFIVSAYTLLLMLILSMNGIYLQIDSHRWTNSSFLKMLFMFSTCLSGIYFIKETRNRIIDSFSFSLLHAGPDC